jgi:hypothetical protein
MKIEVLGSSDAVPQGENAAAFLTDHFLLLDAETVSYSLRSADQFNIIHIFPSQAHSDYRWVGNQDLAGLFFLFKGKSPKDGS